MEAALREMEDITPAQRDPRSVVRQRIDRLLHQSGIAVRHTGIDGPLRDRLPGLADRPAQQQCAACLEEASQLLQITTPERLGPTVCVTQRDPVQ
jgi:hypothetical protein